MPSRNLLLLPHYPKNRPEAAPRVSNGSAWRLAAGSGDYCGAESPSLGFVGLGSARGGIGSGARATGMPFRLVVRGMFPETSSRTAGPVDITPSPLHLRKKTFWGFWVKAGNTRQTHPSNTPLKSQCRHRAGSRPRLAHRYPAHSKARAGPKILNFVLGQASHANPGSTTPDHLGSF